MSEAMDGISERAAAPKARGAKARPDAVRGRQAPARKRKSASDLATTVMASIAIALPLMLYLRQHVEILRYGYEIEALKERHSELAESARELSIQRAAAGSLPEIERRASALGLVAPDPRDVFVATGGDVMAAPGGGGGSVSVTARLD